MADEGDPSKTIAVTKPMARGVSVPIQYPMLSETNYGVWAIKMKIVLHSLGDQDEDSPSFTGSLVCDRRGGQQ